ncbi:hypothetical protein [Chondrinema litorale]|uniref:hypothetical protein n=1 Tax=Chondrinema litorale TaxID=2994555 RepID=UPI0025434002|nr:hypothetical protein [Chondrinema litorale]UZR95314.1 hypothetical protein OQ292_05705 [Chondrinema litorale]
MILQRFFKRVKFLIRRLFASTAIKEVLSFTAQLRAVVENPATTDIIILTPSETDDKVFAKIKDAFTTVDTFEEITAKAKEKEGVDLVEYFVERVRNTKKSKRGAVYLAIASELLRKVDEKYSHSEADTLVQLAYTDQKYRS